MVRLRASQTLLGRVKRILFQNGFQGSRSFGLRLPDLLLGWPASAKRIVLLSFHFNSLFGCFGQYTLLSLTRKG